MKRLFKSLSIVLLLALTVSALCSCGEKEETRVDFGESVNTDYKKIEIVDNEIFAYDKSGARINYNKQFVGVKESVYYAVNNRAVTGVYLCGEKVYYFDENGVYQDQPISGTFFSFDGAVYYAVNNAILKGKQVIGGCVYNFGTDGKMLTGWQETELYANDGRLILDFGFVTVQGATYYLEDGRAVSGTQVIDGSIYNFGSDGKMTVGEKDGYTYGSDGKLVLDGSGFVMINDDKSTVYYLEKNAIQSGECVYLTKLIYADSRGIIFIGKLYDDVYLPQEFVIVLVDGSAWITWNDTLCELDGDLDEDGLPNILESQMGTDLGEKDTDGDGFADGADLAPLDPMWH